MTTTDLIAHRSDCHCGRVRFEVDARSHLQVVDCNCSMCSRFGYLISLHKSEGHSRNT